MGWKYVAREERVNSNPPARSCDTGSRLNNQGDVKGDRRSARHFVKIRQKRVHLEAELYGLCEAPISYEGTRQRVGRQRVSARPLLSGHQFLEHILIVKERKDGCIDPSERKSPFTGDIPRAGEHVDTVLWSELSATERPKRVWGLIRHGDDRQEAQKRRL